LDRILREIIIIIKLISKLIIIAKMSGDSEAAPTYYFSGITFNPDFYTTTSSTYLTKTTGKKYFLSYPTAQGEETISRVYTSQVSTPTPTDTFNLLDSLTGNLYIGENATGTSGQIIQIGAKALTTVKCGALAIKERTINNGLDAAAGNIYIGDQQLGGAINIGAGGGVVRTADSNISIGNYGASAGTIAIGTSAATTNINGKGSIYATSFGIHDTTAVLKIGDTQTTGRLDIGSGGSRSGTGAINIGTAGSAAFQINVGSSSSTTTLAGTSVSVSTKLTTPKIDANDATVGLDIGSNITTGSISIGAVMTNGDITIGNTSSTSGGNIMIGKNTTGDTFIGNGTNSTTGINNGTCFINKLQVGSIATAAGNGIGTGTPFRCMITGQAGGGSASSGTVQLSGMPLGGTGATFLVFANMNTGNTTMPYIVNVNPSAGNTFTYAKLYWTGTAWAGVTSGEVFDYMAIWL
jgi:hypothetical protein